MGEVITHVMTGKYKSKVLTKDDKIMIKTIEKEALGKTKTGKKILKISCVKKAMNEFWKKKEEEGGGLCCRFHTNMCKVRFKELLGNICANYHCLYYSRYKKHLEVLIPNCKEWPEHKFFNFENIVREVKKRYGFVLNEKFEFEEVLYTSAFVPMGLRSLYLEGTEPEKARFEIAYRLYGDGIKYQFAEWFLYYYNDIVSFEKGEGRGYFCHSYDELANSLMYDSVYDSIQAGEFKTLKNYKELRKALFDVSVKGNKHYYDSDADRSEYWIKD